MGPDHEVLVEMVPLCSSARLHYDDVCINLQPLCFDITSGHVVILMRRIQSDGGALTGSHGLNLKVLLSPTENENRQKRK